MSDSVNLKCVYVTATDISGRLIVQGRTRLYGISSAGNTAGGGFVNITLKNGTSSGDTRLIVATSHSGHSGSDAYQTNAPYIDMQSGGILFEDGIYFSADSGFYGGSFFVEGGEDNAS